MEVLVRAAESGWVPDPFIRWGIRRLVAERLQDEKLKSSAGHASTWLDSLDSAPIAINTGDANEQHYEVPPRFFELCLGQHLKYSGCEWSHQAKNLSDAEAYTLNLTCERAEIENGHRILELGCGWGSLTLWMAKQYPDSQITAVSNSAPQRRHIMAQAAQRGLTNVEVITCNMTSFTPEKTFDRIVSVEMFEHMRNWPQLLNHCHSWLNASGKLFLHFFSHQTFCYPFEGEDSSNWMAREFFTGGMMPSHQLPSQVSSPFEVENSWWTPGTHYAQTAEAWLDNIDANKTDAKNLFKDHFGKDAGRAVQRWRMFFMACAEMFAFEKGTEWGVSHHLLAANKYQASCE